MSTEKIMRRPIYFIALMQRKQTFWLGRVLR